jgi:hypothetical protein
MFVPRRVPRRSLDRFWARARLEDGSSARREAALVRHASCATGDLAPSMLTGESCPASPSSMRLCVERNIDAPNATEVAATSRHPMQQPTNHSRSGGWTLSAPADWAGAKRAATAQSQKLSTDDGPLGHLAGTIDQTTTAWRSSANRTAAATMHPCLDSEPERPRA